MLLSGDSQGHMHSNVLVYAETCGYIQTKKFETDQPS